MRAGTRVHSNSYVHVPCSMDPKWLCELQGHNSAKCVFVVVVSSSKSLL